MGAIISIEIAVFLDHLRRFDEPHIDRALVVSTAVAFAITSQRGGGPHECCVDLVSLGIANAPLPFGHPLVVAYFEDMTSCVEAANQAKLPVAGIPGRSLNTWVQFVCVPAKPIVP